MIRVAFRKLILVIALICAITFTALISWLQSESGARFISQKLSQILSNSLDSQVQIDDLDISLFSGISAERVSINQNDQENIYLDRVTINFRPSIFMLWRFDIAQILVEEIGINDLISIKENNQSKASQSSEKMMIGLLPRINIGKINLQKIQINRKIIGLEDDLIFGLKGVGNVNPHNMLTKFDLKAYATDEHPIPLNIRNFEVAGKYDIKQQKFFIKKNKLTSDLFKFDGSTLYNLKTGEIESNIRYSSPLDKIDIIPEYIPAQSLSGSLKFSNNIRDLSIAIQSNIKVKQDTKEKTQDLVASANFNYKSGQLVGESSIEYDDFQLSGKTTYNDGVVATNQELKGNDLHSTFDIKYDLASKLATGKISHHDYSMKKISQYLPIVYSGIIDLDINLQPVANKQHFTLAGHIEELQGSLGKVNHINLNAKSTNLWANDFDHIDLLMQYASVKSMIVKKINFNASIKNNIMNFSSGFVSRDPCLITLQSLGEWRLNQSIVRINSFEGKMGMEKVLLTTPAQIQFNKNFQANLDELQIGDGIVRISSKVADNKLSGKLEVQNISSEICEKIFFDSFHNITMNAEINLNGTVDLPKINTKLSVSKENEKVNKEIQIDGLITKDQSKFNIQLFNQQNNIGVVKAELPSTISIWPFDFKLEREKPAIVDINIFDRMNILELIPQNREQTISAEFLGQLKMRGTIKNPDFSGSMRIENGKYRYKKYNIKINDISMLVKPETNGFTLNNIKLYDTIGNIAVGKGQANWLDKSFKLQLSTKELHPINNLYVQGALSGDINLNGNNQGADIEGSFVLGPLEIRIPDRFNEYIPELEIINSDEFVQTEQVSYPVNLNLELKTNNKVYVKGRGVNTRLEGGLVITGSLSDPDIDGTLRAVEGNYTEFGRTLNVQRSTLEFKGPLGPSPYLNITGITNIEDVEIRVSLTGSITEPALEINSSPSMPREKILSLLLFGTESENISPLQALQLAESANRMSGSKFNPLSLGKKVLFIDTLNFKSSSEEEGGGQSVQAGKYINEYIYLELEHGGSNKSTKSKIEVKVTPKISFEAINQNKENILGLNWKYEY